MAIRVATKAQELEQLAAAALAGSDEAFAIFKAKIVQYAINGPVARPNLSDYPALSELITALTLDTVQ